MNKTYLLILPFLILLLYGGCGSDNNNCVVFSEPPLVDSECLSEDMLELCFGLVCESDPLTTIPVLFRSSCSATDCTTIECNDRSFTELGFNPEGMLFSTVILEGEDLGNVQCRFFQQ